MMKKHYRILYFVILLVSIIITKFNYVLSFVVLLTGLLPLIIYELSKGLDSNLKFAILVLLIYIFPILFSGCKKHYDVIHDYSIVSYDPYLIRFNDNNKTHVKSFPVPNCPDKVTIVKETKTFDFWLAKNINKKVRYYIDCNKSKQ